VSTSPFIAGPQFTGLIKVDINPEGKADPYYNRGRLCRSGTIVKTSLWQTIFEAAACSGLRLKRACLELRCIRKEQIIKWWLGTELNFQAC
jgi:hypothetical protein